MPLFINTPPYVKVWLHAFLISVLHGIEYSASSAGTFPVLGDFLGPTASIESVEVTKISLSCCELQPVSPVTMLTELRRTS